MRGVAKADVAGAPQQLQRRGRDVCVSRAETAPLTPAPMRRATCVACVKWRARRWAAHSRPE
eukprot:754557-Alexandrium_andersonii.AAC.1